MLHITLYYFAEYVPLGETGGLRLKVESAARVVIVLRLAASVPHPTSPYLRRLDEDRSVYFLLLQLLYRLLRNKQQLDNAYRMYLLCRIYTMGKDISISFKRSYI